MKRLGYIPNKQDKLQLQQLLLQPASAKSNEPNDQLGRRFEEKESKNLNKSELDALLRRLTNVTKKQYDIQQQSTHILHNNQELKERRLKGDKVENRLLAKGKEKEKKISEMGEQIEKQQKDKWYRDVPEISEKGHSVQQKTIDKRLNDLLKARQHNKQELTAKYEPSFQPNIDSHSEFINDVQNLGDLFNRMKTKEKDAHKKKTDFMKKIEEQQRELLTFKPIINQKSRDIADNLPPRLISGTPFQKSPSRGQCEKLSFVPDINKRTDQLLRNRDKSQDCFRRLYNQAKESTLKNQSKAKQIEKIRVFNPSLNTKSLKMANSRRQKQKLQGEKSNTSLKDDSDLFFEEVRIGSEAQISRVRTFSLRGSKVSRRTWVQESENMSFIDVKSCLRNKLNLIK